MMRQPFDVPSNVIWDMETGYAINMPLGPQDYPGWQEDRPRVIERIRQLREQNGVVVEDDQFAMKPKSRPLTERPKNVKPSVLPKRRKR